MKPHTVLNRAPRDKGRSAADTAPAGQKSSGAEPLRVTADAQICDHAVIRFLERAYGLENFIAAVRDEMRRGVTPGIDFGASVVIVHGVRLQIIDGYRVVTALPKRKR